MTRVMRAAWVVVMAIVLAWFALCAYIVASTSGWHQILPTVCLGVTAWCAVLLGDIAPEVWK